MTKNPGTVQDALLWIGCTSPTRRLAVLCDVLWVTSAVLQLLILYLLSAG